MLAEQMNHGTTRQDLRVLPAPLIKTCIRHIQNLSNKKWKLSLKIQLKIIKKEKKFLLLKRQTEVSTHTCLMAPLLDIKLKQMKISFQQSWALFLTGNG